MWNFRGWHFSNCPSENINSFFKIFNENLSNKYTLVELDLSRTRSISTIPQFHNRVHFHDPTTKLAKNFLCSKNNVNARQSYSARGESHCTLIALNSANRTFRFSARRRVHFFPNFSFKKLRRPFIFVSRESRLISHRNISSSTFPRLTCSQ